MSSASGAAAADAQPSTSAPRKTGFVFHELYCWWTQGSLGNHANRLQPIAHWESAESKRRLHNLLEVSGLMDELQRIKPRPATKEELATVHTREYIERMAELSKDYTKGTHTAGEEVMFAPGGYDIACLSAGGAIAAVDAVMAGRCANAYALLRPPGHHAEADAALGFCMFNNIAVAARHARDRYGLQRIAIVDWDVHHGNGTQHMFEDDEHVLFICLHQDSNYPLGSGSMDEQGRGPGDGFTINIPFMPGCGSGAYRAAFDRVVVPALEAYRPELILVSSGFDGCFMDPLATMMLSSDDYRYFARVLRQAAERHCGGRLVALHEGGYSELYVPYCGLAVVEELAGVSTGVADPLLHEVQRWGYQSLQAWQDELIGRAERGPLAKLRARVAERLAAAGGDAASTCSVM